MAVTEKPPMRIVEFRAENFKRLRVVEIRPDADVVELTGRNGQGKTSVLDAILAALGGTREIQMKPIRTGCERASIKLDLGEIRIERRFKADPENPKGYTTTVVVESAEGARFTKPQDVLDALVGEFTFDPLAFSRMAPKAQFEALKVLVPGIDFAADEKADKADFEARTIHNRNAASYKSQAEAITLPPGKVPVRIDIEALEAKLAEAGDHNASIETSKARRAAGQQRAQEIGAEIDRLEAERKAILDGLAAAKPLPDPIDTAQVRLDLTAARDANRVADLADRRTGLQAQADAAQAEADKLTKAMKDRATARQKAVAEAKMPIKGLGFGDGFITLDDIPFEQASDAQQLQTSIAIAAAMNPRLRIARVRDGSLLDDVAMQHLRQFAADNDIQVWIERVDSTGTVGFVMENGALKSDAPDVEETV